jgi:serine protein kinase
MPAERPNQQSFDIFKGVDKSSKEQEKIRWEGPFSEYNSAHKNLNQAVRNDPEFFTKGKNAIFGNKPMINRFLELSDAAAEGHTPKNRIWLLVGPPGGGKSTFLTKMKEGLEEYSKKDEGFRAAIADCPKFEEPLRLIPKEYRPEFEAQTGVHVEGDLCPQCEKKYGYKPGIENFGESLRDIPVKRLIMSEKDRVGITTFKPRDPKNQEDSELIGMVDLAKIGEHGGADDPDAYRFVGEITRAERGVLEYPEMLKADVKFHYLLLDLTEQGHLKIPNFANISSDVVIIGHTNEQEYIKFATDKKNEALHGRILVIDAPYNLEVSEEKKIYKKLLNESDMMRRPNAPHINDKALEVAATFAILSRLHKPQDGTPLMKKLQMYDGQTVEGVHKSVEELREENKREGMSGISPRYVSDSLSIELMKLKREGQDCLTPFDAIRALKSGLETHMDTRELKKEDKDKLISFIENDIQQEFNRMAKKEVQSAFVHAFEERAQNMCDDYLENVAAYKEKKKKKNQYTGELVSSDERYMRSIEEQLSTDNKPMITENNKDKWREELYHYSKYIRERGEKFPVSAHPRLKEAIQNKLFEEQKGVLKTTLAAKTPDKEQNTQKDAVSEKLIQEKDYCPHCAHALLDYVGTHIL